METEITVQVFETEENLVKKLESLGFQKTEDVLMKDSYFSKYSLSKLKKMSYKNVLKNSLLVRSFGGERNSNWLVYKNKVVKNDVVVQEEKIKTSIDSVENTKEILLHAGLCNWCNLTQNMHIYKKEETVFAVQVVEGLGTFIEYEEDETMAGFSIAQKIKHMKSKLLELGLNLGDDFACKKPFMMLHLTDKGENYGG